MWMFLCIRNQRKATRLARILAAVCAVVGKTTQSHGNTTTTAGVNFNEMYIANTSINHFINTAAAAGAIAVTNGVCKQVSK